MNIDLCFSTPIFSTVNEKLAAEILPIAKKYLSDQKFLNKDIPYKTTYGRNTSGLEMYDDIKIFADYASDLGYQFLEKLGYDMQKKHCYPYIFASEMFENDNHEVHSHPNSILSGAMYLEVPEGSAPIVFFDPRPKRHFIHMNALNETSGSNNNFITMQPKRGLIIIWESWLEHKVPLNKNRDNGRISLIFNLNFS